MPRESAAVPDFLPQDVGQNYWDETSEPERGSYSLGDVLIELLPRPPCHDALDAEAVVAVGEDAVAVLALAHLLLDDLHADAARLGRAGLGGGLRGPGLRGMGHIPSRISRPWRLQSC